jgi:hypothetical protein
MVQYLLSKYKALSSTPEYQQKRKKKKEDNKWAMSAR